MERERKKASNFEDRVVWLITHRDLWKGHKRGTALPIACSTALKRDGLVAKSTYRADIKFAKELAEAEIRILQGRAYGAV